MAIMIDTSRDKEELYELPEAAQALNIGIATLYRWMNSGKIIPQRFYRRTFIPKSEIERLKK